MLVDTRHLRFQRIIIDSSCFKESLNEASEVFAAHLFNKESAFNGYEETYAAVKQVVSVMKGISAGKRRIVWDARHGLSPTQLFLAQILVLRQTELEFVVLRDAEGASVVAFLGEVAKSATTMNLEAVLSGNGRVAKLRIKVFLIQLPHGSMRIFAAKPFGLWTYIWYYYRSPVCIDLTR